MKALTWQGRRELSVDEVPDPRIEAPTDAIVQITSTAICGSDLHLYELLGPFIDRGDILGHEPMGVVVAVGDEVTQLAVGDRVVVPFTISCGHCFMCRRGLQSQCETTQVTEYNSGAALFGYTKLYGQVPGGQAEYLRVPLADYNHIRVGSELPDDRYLFLSDILPTAAGRGVRRRARRWHPRGHGTGSGRPVRGQGRGPSRLPRARCRPCCRAARHGGAPRRADVRHRR